MFASFLFPQDPTALLAPENISQDALFQYAR